MSGVNNVETGLKKIKQRDFRILITDVRENSEFDKSFISKAKEVQDSLRIIAITSYPDKITEAELRAYGADYLFIKPLELRKLDEAIKSCLNPEIKLSH